MSDSDCSNCDEDCEYRDYTYDCYVHSCKQINDVTSSEMKQKLIAFKKDIGDLAEKHAEYQSVLYSIDQILEAIDDFQGIKK